MNTPFRNTIDLSFAARGLNHLLGRMFQITEKFPNSLSAPRLPQGVLTIYLSHCIVHTSTYRKRLYKRKTYFT